MIVTRWRYTFAGWAESHQRLYGDGPDYRPCPRTGDGDPGRCWGVEAAVEPWGNNPLTAADDPLLERINDLPQLASSSRSPCSGSIRTRTAPLRSPEATPLAEHQLSALLDAIGLLAARES